MKKFISIVLVLVLALSVSGCSEKAEVRSQSLCESYQEDYLDTLKMYYVSIGNGQDTDISSVSIALNQCGDSLKSMMSNYFNESLDGYSDDFLDIYKLYLNLGVSRNVDSFVYSSVVEYWGECSSGTSKDDLDEYILKYLTWDSVDFYNDFLNFKDEYVADYSLGSFYTISDSIEGKRQVQDRIEEEVIEDTTTVLEELISD